MAQCIDTAEGLDLIQDTNGEVYVTLEDDRDTGGSLSVAIWEGELNGPTGPFHLTARQIVQCDEWFNEHEA